MGVLRKDLGWPAGAMINQASHLSMSVAWDARHDDEAIQYMSNSGGQMVTYTMGVKDEEELMNLVNNLKDGGIPFRTWEEHPENVVVGLATWPRRRSELQKFFKGIKR